MAAIHRPPSGASALPSIYLPGNKSMNRRPSRRHDFGAVAGKKDFAVAVVYAIYLVERHALLRGRVVGRRARPFAIGLVDYIYAFAVGANPYPAVGSLVQGDGYHGVVAVCCRKMPPLACFIVEERHAAVVAKPIVAVGVFKHGVDGVRRLLLRVERLMDNQFNSIAETRV